MWASTRPSSVPTSTLQEHGTARRAMCLLNGWRWRWRTSKAHVAGRASTTQGARSNYKKSPGPDPDPPPDGVKPVQREALGRSRGGLSTKVHLAADSRSRPLGFITTLGQRHDSIAFELT